MTDAMINDVKILGQNTGTILLEMIQWKHQRGECERNIGR